MLGTYHAERRKQRAHDTPTALRYQLEQVRARARLEAVVLADDGGLLLARDGDPELCEQLAALAPLLGLGAWDDCLLSELDATRIAVSSLQFDGHPLFLAWSGDVPDRDWLESAGSGLRRILSLC